MPHLKNLRMMGAGLLGEMILRHAGLKMVTGTIFEDTDSVQVFEHIHM